MIVLHNIKHVLSLDLSFPLASIKNLTSLLFGQELRVVNKKIVDIINHDYANLLINHYDY